MGTHWLVMDAPGNGAAAPFSTRLAGAGRHLPATHLTTHDLMSTTRHKTHIDLERLTGIHERRVSVGDEDSYSLATKAALNCLDKAEQSAASLDVVISCSITKFRGGLTQWVEPTMSSAVAHAIGADRAMTFDLSKHFMQQQRGVADGGAVDGTGIREHPGPGLVSFRIERSESAHGTTP
jgi:3-oxoacyl-[acyl-carrier-protein] synthase-3